MYFDQITLPLGDFRKLCMSHQKLFYWAIKNHPANPKSPSNRNSPDRDNLIAEDENFAYIGCNNNTAKASWHPLDVMEFRLRIQRVSNILYHKNVKKVLCGGQFNSTCNQTFGGCAHILYSIIGVRAIETSKMNGVPIIQ